MSAVGTTLLQSPGCNEGKARYETLGIHEPKVISSSGGAALITRAFVLRLGSAAPLGLNKCVPIINPGLAPWAMQEYRPYRAHLRLPIYFIILMQLPCSKAHQYAYSLVENPHYLKSSLPFGQKALSLDHTITFSSIITP